MNHQVTDLDRKNWDQIIAPLPGSHVLQTWEWGAVKSQYGWYPTQHVWYDNDNIVAASLVLNRSTNIPFFSRITNIFYIPKGPLLDWSNPIYRREVLLDIIGYAKKNGGLFLKIDPDIILGTGFQDTSKENDTFNCDTIISELKQLGWHFSKEQIQFKNTVQIDLSPNEDTLLANMKQKTRYNIRLASRKGVTVRVGTKADINTLYQMYAETSLRDGFIIRGEEYYQTTWGSFFQDNRRTDLGISNVEYNQPVAEPLIAEVNGEAIAAVIIFRFARNAWYIYGMSRAIHREKMPNYLLQWEALRRAKLAGCHTYDLWGAPDANSENDPLWGVYQFKEGFGGKVIRHLGAWDKPIKPVYYEIYNSLLPRILAIMRIINKKTTKQSIYG